MSKTIAKFAVLTLLLGSAAAGPAGQTPAGPDDARLYPTGLIPLTAEEDAEIRASWPRVAGVGVNWLGYERINEARAKSGRPALDPLSVRPVGREVETAVGLPEVSTQAADAGLAADLPVSVDNSKLKYFPPIRSQGSLGSCASFATTYTQLSYMTAFQRDLDIRSTSDNTNKYSPKWTYNMINGGSDGGSSFSQVFPLLERHGAATWAEFPYDANYLAWNLNPAVWRKALSVRSNPVQYVRNVSAAAGMQYVRELLANGYVLVFGTYISSWQYTTAGDDPSTADDDAAAGDRICHWLNGSDGSHAMTVVGYNDAVWADVNGNGTIDPGEKGAFRIANSWGTYWEDGGFVWLAYDALQAFSAVAGGPSAGRNRAFQNDQVYLLTARDSYAPLLIAEFTVNHAKRNQLKMTLGHSTTASTAPTTTWTPLALQNQGGAYAFDGTATAVDGGFVLDYSDILVEGAGLMRYHLGAADNLLSDPATLKAFKLVDLTTSPATETVFATVPQTVDADTRYFYVDYAYTGPTYDHPPVLSYPQVSPATGTTGDTFSYTVYYSDQDGDAPSVKDVTIDGAPHAMALASGSASAGWYRYDTELASGGHEYYFSFRDSRGGTARAPLAGTTAGPEVFAFLLASISPSSGAAGGTGFTLTVDGSDFVNGAVVTWDGNDRATTYVSGARLTASIAAGDIAAGKTVQVAVRNPDGGISNPLEFDVLNPAPILTALSPDHASAGGGAFTLTATGANFIPGASLAWAGTPRTATYVGPTSLTAAIAAADIAAGGEFSVTVVNPQPGGGSSAGVAFPVASFTIGSGLLTATVNAGASASYPLQVTPQFDSYDGAVALQCSGLPKGATASFVPSSVTPGATGAASQLTLSTTARQSAAAGAAGRAAGGGGGPSGLGLTLLAALALPALSAGAALARPGAKRLARRLAAAGAALVLAFAVSSCSAGGGGGGASTDNGTPAGTYQITVRGVSGTLAVTTTVELVVR